MMVIALGRLGMREFDLGSDADLVFVIPDADAAEHAFWTGVAERMIQTLSAYTGEGVMFTVDTRLRPNGREGDLVQIRRRLQEPTSPSHAEAWEGITYMKSRAVAGNVERATEFLHELQEVDWRRYGQSMRSRKELAEMRARLEREQGPRNPLKAGAGGYYDIDFALMYLRLQGRRHLLQGAEHAGAHRRDREDGPPGPRGRRLSARRRHLLPRHRSRPARLHRPRRGQPAHLAGAVRGADQPGEALDAGASAPAAPGRDAARNPPPHARVLQPAVRTRHEDASLQPAPVRVVRRCADASIVARLSRAAPCRVNHTTVALTLLLAILGISARWGLAEATLASVVAVLGFNFYFLPPVGTFTIQDPQNWVALLAFLVTAVTASQLSARARRRAAEAEARRAGNRAALRAGAGHDADRQRAQDHPRVRQPGGAGIRLRGGGVLLPARPTKFFRSGPESQAGHRPRPDSRGRGRATLSVDADRDCVATRPSAWAAGPWAAWR